jgi:hypothetical protein
MCRQSRVAFAAVCSVGGDQGWFPGEWLWRSRGVMDQVDGVPGLRRGRRKRLAIGDALDFWRIEELVPPQASPPPRRDASPRRGTAEVGRRADTHVASGITQTALFRPGASSDGPAGWRWPRFTASSFRAFRFPR